MKALLTITVILFLSISTSAHVKAGDFDWLDNLSIQATADPSGFRVSLGTRFQIGDAQIQAIIGQVNSHADAYMVLRLGELSHRAIKEVLGVYRSGQHKGWGKMAKDLGIKPGSSEFHALKKGHDLDNGGGHKSNKSKDKKNKKNKGKEKKNKGEH